MPRAIRALPVVLAMLASANVPAGPFERLAGSVRTEERATLPADATLTLELLDVSRPDARAERLARLALPTRGRQAPLAFELPFHPDDVKSAHRYVLRATLVDGGGEVLFAGTQAALANKSRTVDLVLQRVRHAAPPPALENTYWKLSEVQGQPARTEPGERDAYLLLLDGRVSGGSGCNKLMGSYRTDSRNALALGPLAATRMACAPDVMTQEAALLDAFRRTTAYRIDGETLTLLENDSVLARFVARPVR